MSKQTTVEFNEKFFQELGQNPALVSQCLQVALGIRRRAVARAKVDTGAYVGRIDVVRADRNGRVCWLVVAADKKSLILESRYGTLARSIKG